MIKPTKITAFVFALTLGAVSMTACGNSSEPEKTDSETKIETTSESADSQVSSDDEISTADSQVSSDNEVSENENVEYSPREEIINADYSSGLIQIGNDLFRMGGYMTVNDFIAEYGDRYDMSEFRPDDYFSSSHNKVTVKSNTDKSISFSVWYESPEADYDKQKETKVGDCLVISYFAIFTDPEKTWTPYAKDGMPYTDVVSFVDSLDLVKLDNNRSLYDSYWEHEVLGTKAITIYEIGKEKNLLGVYPIFSYNYYEFSDTGNAGNGLIQLDFKPTAQFRERKGITEWHSAKETE